MAVVRNLMVRAGADFSAMRKSMQKAQKDLNNFKNGVNKTMRMIGAALAATGVTLGLGAATKEAMQFEASLQQINRLMGDNSKAFQQWANDQASAFGMARSEAVKYGAVFSNLISTFTSGTAQTAQYTQDLLKAAAVVSSATGRTMEDTMDRIRSGLLGSTEAIEDLGININVSMLEATESFRKFANGKSWAQLDFHTQQTIRYFAILEQAATKYGLELAVNTTSRQAEFVAELKNAQLALGQAFLPIYNTVLPALTSMARALADAMQWLAAFSQALFGGGQQDQTKALESQAKAVGAVGDAYEEAGKKARGSVAGFDEINQLTQPTATAGGTTARGGASEGIAASPLIASLASEETSSVAQKAEEMANRVKSAIGSVRSFIAEQKDLIISSLSAIGAGFATAFIGLKWSSITAGLASLWASLTSGTGAIAAITSGIRAFWLAITGPVGLVTLAVSALVGAFVYFYRTNEGFRGVVDGILQKIGEVAIWLWQEVLVPLGKFLGDAFLKAWEGITKAAEWFWKEVAEPLGRVLGEVLYLAFETVSDIAKSFWKNVLVPLGKFIADNFDPAVEALSVVFDHLWKNVLQPFAKFLLDTMKKRFEELTTVITWLWDYALKPVAKYVAGAFKKSFEDTFETVGIVIEGAQKVFNGLLTFITGAFTNDWKKAWEGVTKVFDGVFGSLWEIAKRPLNQLIDGLNHVIAGLNRISFSIPDWDWLPDEAQGKSFGINIPRIPKLKTGGLAYGPTLAVVGDNAGARSDPEVISPLSKLQSMIGADSEETVFVLRQILQAVREGRSVQAVISRDDVGRAATGYINDEARRGRNPLPAL